jgi:hypothetical protein
VTAPSGALTCVTCGHTGTRVVLKITGSVPSYAECSSEFSALCEKPSKEKP